MHKIADGLLSGRYSHTADYSSPPPLGAGLQHPSPTPVFQQGIRPIGFKTLIGKGHEEFSTMKQQDSEEFFTHLLTVLRRDAHKYKDRSEQGRSILFFSLLAVSSHLLSLQMRLLSSLTQPNSACSAQIASVCGIVRTGWTSLVSLWL